MAGTRRAPQGAPPSDADRAKAERIAEAQKDYITVAERIRAFYEAHPDGMIGMLREPYVQVIDGKSYWIYLAKAIPDLRSPERYGVGSAQEIVPGLTPFTRGSELQNAETAAWGRSIASLGFAVKNEIATVEEARARDHERESGVGLNDQEIAPLPDDRKVLAALIAELTDLTGENWQEKIEAWVVAHSTNHVGLDELTRHGYLAVIERLRRTLAREQEERAGATETNSSTETEEAATGDGQT